MNKKFDATAIKNDMLIWIRQWFKENGGGGKAVIAISGGKDSAIAAAMLVEALGKDEVIGIILPYGYSDDISNAVKLVEFLDIEFHVVHIRQSYNALEAEVREEVGPLTKGAAAIMQERVRMAAMSGINNSKNGVFVNTSNYSESWLGYFTRYGDISPFLKLTISEVIALGGVLGFPENFLEDMPADGLWGFLDEETLGFSYEKLDDYIRYGIYPDPESKERIDYVREHSYLRRALVMPFPYGDDE